MAVVSLDLVALLEDESMPPSVRAEKAMLVVPTIPDDGVRALATYLVGEFAAEHRVKIDEAQALLDRHAPADAAPLFVILRADLARAAGDVAGENHFREEARRLGSEDVLRDAAELAHRLTQTRGGSDGDA